VISREFVQKFTKVASSPEPDLAPAALLIARLEYPRLDASEYLERLDEMGAIVGSRFARLASNAAPRDYLATLNQFLVEEQGFAGDRTSYDDLRNSFLNEVMDRRTGIPVTLALVYIEVARRAGIRVDGVNFPGHFLLRLPGGAHSVARPDDVLIVDPFHAGAVLSEHDCLNLLRQHAGEDAVFDRRLLAPATKPQILVRMLVNLKRAYVRMRSYPQARDITELLLGLNPSALTELRDRGLLAYHLNDFSAALRDLETYLRFTSRAEEANEASRSEQAEIWEHVKSLRRRVASLN